MQYELIRDSNAGVIIDPTPVLRDIKDTFMVSFLLPCEGAYIALFRGEDNVERKVVIRDGAAEMPKELLTKEQRVGLTVCRLDGENIVQAWECWSLRVGAFLYLRQSQWQVTAGMDDKDFFARFAELERTHAQSQADYAMLKAHDTDCKNNTAELVAKFKLELYKQGEALASLKTDTETTAKAYNKAIEVINDLSNRVHALEKNYDPTIIK